MGARDGGGNVAQSWVVGRGGRRENGGKRLIGIMGGGRMGDAFSSFVLGDNSKVHWHDNISRLEGISNQQINLN